MPHLRHVVGRDCFAGESGQWRVFLRSGLRTARELKDAHAAFKVMVQDARGQAGVPVLTGDAFQPGPGSPSRRDVGSFTGSTLGGVQQAMLEELEGVRAARLEWMLQRHLPRTSKQRIALEECDVKASALPFTALPTPGQLITNMQFAEGMADYLGIDSPLCAGRVGESIAGKVHRDAARTPWVLDRYGDNISSVPLEDHFRTRHDAVKLVIPRVCRWAGVHCVVEVYNQFAALLSQEALALNDTQRKQQAVVPDILTQGQVPGVAEVKIISCVPSHYPRKIRGDNAGVRPVDVKASTIQGEYEGKLWDADPTGRAVARLRDHGPVKGLVVGAFGEFSSDLHKLLNDLVEAKIPGTPEGTRAARSHAKPWVRRQLAIAAMRQRADMKINGLAFCGPGGKEAYDRRNSASRADSAVRADMEAADFATLFRTHRWEWIRHRHTGG